MMTWVRLFCVTFVAAAMPTVSIAAPIVLLDQEFDPSSANFYPTPWSNVDWAQTFTVGLSGTLDHVELRLHRSIYTTLPLLVDVRTTSAGVPTENDAGTNVLGSVTVPAASISTSFSYPFTSIDFSSLAIPVTAGDVLALAVRSDTPSSALYEMFSVREGGFSGGSAFVRIGSGTWAPYSSYPNTDIAFRTFVLVPEPSTALLLAAGLAGLALRRQLLA